MGEYRRIRIPKTTKASIKLFIFHLADLLIVSAFFIVGYYLQEFIQLPPVHYLFFQALNVALGIFCCLPTSYCPGKKTIQVIIQLFLKDRRRYAAGSYRRKAGGE